MPGPPYVIPKIQTRQTTPQLSAVHIYQDVQSTFYQIVQSSQIPHKYFILSNTC